MPKLRLIWVFAIHTGYFSSAHLRSYLNFKKYPSRQKNTTFPSLGYLCAGLRLILQNDMCVRQEIRSACACAVFAERCVCRQGAKYCFIRQRRLLAVRSSHLLGFAVSRLKTKTRYVSMTLCKRISNICRRQCSFVQQFDVTWNTNTVYVLLWILNLFQFFINSSLSDKAVFSYNLQEAHYMWSLKWVHSISLLLIVANFNNSVMVSPIFGNVSDN